MHDAKYLSTYIENISLPFSLGAVSFFSILIFFLFFLAFSRCLRTYFQLLCCASIRFRASPKHTLGRSDFARLVENDLLIAEKTSSVGVLGVLESFPSFIGVGEDSYGRQWIRSVGRVFRPSGKTRIWEGGRRVTVAYTLASGSYGGAMFSRGLSRNVARLSATTNPGVGRSGIQFREPGHRCRIICHRLAFALLFAARDCTFTLSRFLFPAVILIWHYTWSPFQISFYFGVFAFVILIVRRNVWLEWYFILKLESECIFDNSSFKIKFSVKIQIRKIGNN